MVNPFDQFDTLAQSRAVNPFDQFDSSESMLNAPVKIGADSFHDTLKHELANTDWATRNIAGAGTALSNLWERAKQAVGQGDAQAIKSNRIIAEAAPVGAIAGNVALMAPTALIPGANTYTGAALIGAATGALQPTVGDESTLKNVGTGALAGMAGKGFGDLAAKGLNAIAQKQAAALAAKQSRNAPIDETLREGLAAGYSVPPSMRDAGLLMRGLEGFAGPSRTAALFSNKNQEITDALARKAVGLPENAALTSEAMQQIRRDAYKASYDPIAKIGKIVADEDYNKALDSAIKQYTGATRSFGNAIPDDVGKLVASFRVNNFDAGDALQASQALRDRANAAFRSGNTGFAKAAKDISKALEDQIERTLSYKSNSLRGWKELDDVLGKRMSGSDFDMVKGARTIIGRLKDGKISQENAIKQLQEFFAISQPNSKTARSAIENAAQKIMLSSNDAEKSAAMLQGFREARKLMAKAHTIEDAIQEGGGRVSAQKLGQRLQSGKYLSDELKTIAQMANNFKGIMQVPIKGAATPFSGAEAILAGGGSFINPAVLAIPVARTATRYALRSAPVQKVIGIPDYAPNALLRLMNTGAQNELLRRAMPAIVAGEAVGGSTPGF